MSEQPSKYEHMTADQKANAMADDCVGDPWELLGYFREKLWHAQSEADCARDAAIEMAKKSARPAPAMTEQQTADEIVEVVARTIYERYAGPEAVWRYVDPHYQETVWREHARAAIAAARSMIEAEEREKCAKLAEGLIWQPSGLQEIAIRMIAAAIRAMGGERP